MSSFRLQAVVGMSLVVVALAGCTQSRSVTLGPDDVSGLADASGERAAGGVPPMNRTASRTAPPAESTIAAVPAEPERSPAAPSLVTLPRGANLEDQLAGAQGTVLLDFYADWCGPCRMQSRILHELESEVAERGSLIVKINVDEHPEIAERFAVSSLPTLLVVNDGEVRNRKIGLTDKDQLLAWIE